MKKITFIVFILVLLAVLAFVIGAAPVAATDQSTRNRLLNATVRICMYAPILRDGRMIEMEGGVLQDTSSGLGTLVRVEATVFVVSHDHWAVPFAGLSHVTFSSVSRQELTTISRSQFMQLLRYQDGGTLVMVAPEALQSLPALEISPEFAQIGTRFDVVYRDPASDTVNVIPMVLDASATYGGLPTWQLRCPTREVIEHGNSGAGVFLNGRLAGNIWTTVRVAVWIPWGDGEYVQQFDTLLSTAARFPAAALAAMQ